MFFFHGIVAENISQNETAKISCSLLFFYCISIAYNVLDKFLFFCLWKATCQLDSRHLVWYILHEVYLTLDFSHLLASNEITPDGEIPVSSHLHLFLLEAICSLWEQTEGTIKHQNKPNGMVYYYMVYTPYIRLLLQRKISVSSASPPHPTSPSPRHQFDQDNCQNQIDILTPSIDPENVGLSIKTLSPSLISISIDYNMQEHLFQQNSLLSGLSKNCSIEMKMNGESSSGYNNRELYKTF